MIDTKRYSKIAKLLAVIAVILAVIPVLYAFLFAGLGRWGTLISIGLPTAFVSLGYGLQALCAKVVGYRKQDKEIEVNGKLQYVDPGVAAFPMIVCAGLGVGLYYLEKYLLSYFEIRYDPYSVYIFLIPAGIAAFAVAGAIFWFYPYDKLLPMSSLAVFGGIFMFTFMLSVLFLRVSTLILTVCFILFFIIFMTVSNLRNIEESIKHAKFRMPENDFRSYNFAMTVKYLVMTFLIATLVFSCIYAVSSNITPSPEPIEQERTEWTPQDHGEMGIGNDAQNGLDAGIGIEENSSGTTIPQLLSYIVVVGGLVVLLFWLCFKKNLFGKMFIFLSAVWVGFFEFFAELFDIIGRIGRKEEYEFPLSYVDTEGSVDPYIDYESNYGEHGSLLRLSIKEFDRILSEKESLEEQYAYAYSTYCGLIRLGDNGVKGSDTPRVLTQKLKAQRKADLEAATPVYEDIRYRLIKPEASPEKNIDELISMVHAQLRIL